MEKSMDYKVVVLGECKWNRDKFNNHCKSIARVGKTSLTIRQCMGKYTEG